MYQEIRINFVVKEHVQFSKTSSLLGKNKFYTFCLFVLPPRNNDFVVFLTFVRRFE